MIGVAKHHRPWRPCAHRSGHPRHRTVRHHRRCPEDRAGTVPMAAEGRHRAEAHRRRTAHPGGHAGAAWLPVGGPLAAVRPHRTAAAGSLPAQAAGLQQAPASGGAAAAVLHPGAGNRHRPVGRRRVDRRLHPGGVRPVHPDSQALGAGGVGRLRLLRIALALLTGGCGCSWCVPCTACRWRSRWPPPPPTSVRRWSTCSTSSPACWPPIQGRPSWWTRATGATHHQRTAKQQRVRQQRGELDA